MGDKLSGQETKFVKLVVETDNLTESTQKAFGIEDPNYAGVKGHRLIRKDKIVKAIQTLADRIPDDLITEKHLALLRKTDAKGEIDVQAVKAGLEMAHKLKGAYSDEAHKTTNILMPVLVKFLDKKDDETSDNGNT